MVAVEEASGALDSRLGTRAMAVLVEGAAAAVGTAAGQAAVESAGWGARVGQAGGTTGAELEEATAAGQLVARVAVRAARAAMAGRVEATAATAAMAAKAVQGGEVAWPEATVERWLLQTHWVGQQTERASDDEKGHA